MCFHLAYVRRHNVSVSLGSGRYSMNLLETFQIATIVEKLPPAWRDFKNYLKRMRKKLKLEDLIVRLRIDEDNRKSEKRSCKNSYEAKTNVIKDSKRKASTSKGLKRKKTA